MIQVWVDGLIAEKNHIISYMTMEMMMLMEIYLVEIGEQCKDHHPNPNYLDHRQNLIIVIGIILIIIIVIIIMIRILEICNL